MPLTVKAEHYLIEHCSFVELPALWKRLLLLLDFSMVVLMPKVILLELHLFLVVHLEAVLLPFVLFSYLI